MDSDNLRRGLTGAVVGATWVAGLFVSAPLAGGFGLAGVADRVIYWSPGWLSTLAVEVLGFSAQPVLVGGLVLGTVAATAGVAVVWPRLPPWRGTAAVVAGVLATVALLVGGGSTPGGAVVGCLVAVLSAYVAASWMTTYPVPSDRRGFLRRVGRVGGGAVVVLGGLRFVFDRLSGDPTSERADQPLERSVSPPTGDPAFDFRDMPAAVTRPDDHYVVDINVNDPRVDPETWTLDVRGAVERPYGLTYDELLDHDESVEQTATLICISNTVGGDLVGNAHWTGVPLSELVAAADPADSAVDVVTHAADGYSEAIPVDVVEREDVLIAYGMGDRTLAVEHGFPARLLIPGRYGMKMTKWVTGIEVTDADHEAYWEARGWDEEAVANTMSVVRGAQRDDDGRVTVGGIAFSGAADGVEGIAGVEVSVDGGETWHEADLEPPVSPHAWRRWRYAFTTPDRPEYDVVVRATTRDGTLQTAEETGPHPGGATGWHRKTVRL